MAHVLIADDDPVFVEVAALMLESYGHVVAVAADGEAAVAGITSQTDVILVDIFMPLKDGLEVIIELRQTRPDLRIIAVSSTRNTDFDQLVTAKALGAHAALAKPVAGDQLNDLINRLHSGRGTHSNFVD